MSYYTINGAKTQAVDVISEVHAPPPFLVTFCVFACLSFVNDEAFLLTDAEIADALNREDELGKLVSCAFSFDVLDFGEVAAGVGSFGKEGC